MYQHPSTCIKHEVVESAFLTAVCLSEWLIIMLRCSHAVSG